MEARWLFPSGSDATEVEQFVLDWWREVIRAPFGCRADQMPRAGHTEMAPLGCVSSPEILSFIEEITGMALLSDSEMLTHQSAPLSRRRGLAAPVWGMTDCCSPMVFPVRNSRNKRRKAAKFAECASFAVLRAQLRSNQ
jgi:hypothetical protein